MRIPGGEDALHAAHRGQLVLGLRQVAHVVRRQRPEDIVNILELQQTTFITHHYTITNFIHLEKRFIYADFAVCLLVSGILKLSNNIEP